MIEFDFDKIEEYKVSFEKCEDMLPLILMIFVNSKRYIDNLKKKGLYDDIERELFARRELMITLSDEDLLSFEESELNEWLVNHDEFKDIILLS